MEDRGRAVDSDSEPVNYGSESWVERAKPPD